MSANATEEGYSVVGPWIVGGNDRVVDAEGGELAAAVREAVGCLAGGESVRTVFSISAASARRATSSSTQLDALDLSRLSSDGVTTRNPEGRG